MNVETPTAPAPVERASGPLTALELDRSCQGPALFLLASAAVWWALGALMAAAASVEMHSPGFLAGVSWLSFGRLHPAANNALVYGFGAQIALSFYIWATCRLCKARLRSPIIISLGIGLWNFAVTLGVLAILGGGNSGFEWLEMPVWTAPMLFLAYLTIGLFTLLTYSSRTVENVYASQWFALAGVFWFPWVYSAAVLMLQIFPVRGVMQAVVDGWYVQNLLWVWLSLAGVGAIFYLVPKLLVRPLYSHYSAMFAFWTLAFFGSWAGIPAQMPVPRWIPSVSIVLGFLTSAPLLAVLLNIGMTAGAKAPHSGTPYLYKFIIIATLSYVTAGFLQIAGSFRSAAGMTNLTLYHLGIEYLQFFAFFALALVSVAYYLADRLSGLDLAAVKSAAAQLWLLTIGALLTAVPLIVGGLVQGGGAAHPGIPYPEVARALAPFIGASTLGWIALLAAAVVFCANMFRFCAAAFSDWHRLLTASRRS